MKRIVLLTFIGSLALSARWAKPADAWPSVILTNLRIAEPQSNALRGSCLCRQIILLPSKQSVFRFWAEMHPEKDAATLNKCKPQKV